MFYGSIPMGIIDATTTTIGNSIGANKVSRAWSDFKLITLVNIFINIVAALFLYFDRR